MKPGFGRIQSTFSAGRWTPQIPTELASVVYASTQVNLTGTYSGSGEDGFSWERSDDNGATYTEIGTTGAGVKAYSDTTVSTREKYIYRFSSYKGATYGAYSPVSTIDSAEWLTYWQAQIAALLTTTNCPARFDYNDLATITKGGTTQQVSRWNDKLGSGHDLIQATGGLQPVWSERGILLNQQTMKTGAFTYVQGEEIFLLIKPRKFTESAQLYYFDGYSLNSGVLWSDENNVGWCGAQAYSGSLSAKSYDTVLEQWTIIRVLFNGAASELQVDDNDIVYFSSGSNNMGGFTLAGQATGGAKFNMEVKDILLTKGGFSSGEKNIIYEYLKIRKYLGDIVEEKLLHGAVCLRFDDYPVGATGWYDQAYTTIQSKGVKVSVGVPMSFMLAPQWVALKQMYDDGHEVMNHSYAHVGYNTMTAAEIEADVSAAETLFASHAIGRPTGVIEPNGDYYLTGDKLDVIKAHFTHGSEWTYYGIYIFKNTDKLYMQTLNWTADVRLEINFLRTMDYVKFMKYGVTLTNHGIANSTVMNSIIPLSWVSNLIDHCQSIGLDILKLSELYTLMNHV